MSACVFLGPSLSLSDARQILPDAHYLPPVRQSDVYRAVNRFGPSAVAIIDGYFQQVPAVWHKEILWCLAEGTPVYGAASMGALRAAELNAFGMIGIGRIYQAYCDGYFAPYDNECFEDDDEVALMHGPAELNFVAVTEAMVNIRCTLAKAAEQEIITTTTRDGLVAYAKQQYYAERKYSSLLSTGFSSGTGADKAELKRLQAWLPQGRVDQKREDALLLLNTIGAGPTVMPPKVHFEPTTLWRHMLQTLTSDSLTLSEQDEWVLQRARENPQLWQELCQTALLHHIIERLQDPDDRLAAAGDLRAMFKEWRETRGLYTQAALEQFLNENQMNLKKLQFFLQNEISLTTLVSDGNLQELVLDILRYKGDYARYIVKE